MSLASTCLTSATPFEHTVLLPKRSLRPNFQHSHGANPLLVLPRYKGNNKIWSLAVNSYSCERSFD